MITSECHSLAEGNPVVLLTSKDIGLHCSTHRDPRLRGNDNSNKRVCYTLSTMDMVLSTQWAMIKGHKFRPNNT